LASLAAGVAVGYVLCQMTASSTDKFSRMIEGVDQGPSNLASNNKLSRMIEGVDQRLSNLAVKIDADKGNLVSLVRWEFVYFTIIYPLAVTMFSLFLKNLQLSLQ
jgi:hypothetical protein